MAKISDAEGRDMRSWEKKLEKIHFKPENGLVLCDNPKVGYMGELCHIHEKAKKLEADAVLFRRKYDENGDKIIDSKPALYIYTKNDVFFNSKEHKELHAKIWSAGDIEVYSIVSQTRIDIFNARKPAEVKADRKLSLEGLCLVSEALEKFDDQRFSAIVFGKGVFWEQEDFVDSKKDKQFFRNKLSEEDAPFHRLLEYLMSAREDMIKKHPAILTGTIDKLLLVCILIKYMEGIKGDNDKHTLKEIYRKHGIKSERFEEALRKGVCVSVLDELSGMFNGKVFGLSENEKQGIEKIDSESVADFLEAKIEMTKDRKQRFLWEQYDFNHLPAELISAVYENFIQKGDVGKEKGIVNTPPFLANFLIDESMPFHKSKEFFYQNRFRVLDPSCGSGVFLVAAYKRMLQWWSINHYNKTNEIKFPPDKEVCQKIMEDNIFDIDVEPTARFITVFSLTIALLDKLERKKIWNDLKLNSLSDNIKERNFFEWAKTAKFEGRKFELVIGNPPFNPKSGTNKNDAIYDSEVFGISSKDIPGKDFALRFFEGAMFFGEKVCMILPSGVLLYNKSKSAMKYRNRIFSKFTTEKIFDFTHLRRVLFGSSDVAACAILATPTESNGKAIEHTVVKRVALSENKIRFEIDHYDRHFVRHDWATDETKQFVWKTNLLGGGRLFHLIYRLSLLPTLSDFIRSKSGWQEARGFEGGTELLMENQDRITDINKNGEPIIEKNAEIRSDNLKKQFMYKPPFMIIDQVLGDNNLSTCFISEKNNFTNKPYLYYNRDFIGISVPKEDEENLRNIYNIIQLKNNNNRLNYQLYALAISSSSLVLTESDINKTEILSIPYYRENEEYLILSETEKILQEDVLKYYILLGKSISKEGAGRILNEKVGKEQLENFGKIFCSIINPMHAENGMFWQIGEFYPTPEKAFIIYKFVFGVERQAGQFEIKTSSVDDLDKNLKYIVFNDKENKAAVFTRVMRIYGSQDDYDYLILIKPTATRYWLNSIAIRDADETITDYYEAGY